MNLWICQVHGVLTDGATTKLLDDSVAGFVDEVRTCNVAMGLSARCGCTVNPADLEITDKATGQAQTVVVKNEGLLDPRVQQVVDALEAEVQEWKGKCEVWVSIMISLDELAAKTVPMTMFGVCDCETCVKVRAVMKNLRERIDLAR